MRRAWAIALVIPFVASWAILVLLQLSFLTTIQRSGSGLDDAGDAGWHLAIDSVALGVVAAIAFTVVRSAFQRCDPTGMAIMAAITIVSLLMIVPPVLATQRDPSDTVIGCQAATEAEKGGGEVPLMSNGGWSWTQFGAVVYVSNDATGKTTRAVCR